MNAIESTNAQPVANLAAAKKEQAAARRRHPAGKAAPAEAPAKAPAKKAASAKPSTKIKWTATSDKDSRGDCEATGTVSDRRYAITKDGDSWKAVVTVGKGKATVLAEGLKTGRAAWSRCVADAKSVAA